MTADLDRWREIALRDPTGYQSSGVPGSGLTIPFWTLPDLLKVIAEAVAEETERCAKIAENTPTALLPSGQFLSERVAAAIRQTESPTKETERARIARADKIILQLTMHHHSDPDYVKGYEQAQEYFADYAVRSMIPAPFPVITDKEGNVLACVPINLKEPPK